MVFHFYSLYSLKLKLLLLIIQMGISDEQKVGFMGSCKRKLISVVGRIKKLGRDDPRRIIHSLKVGLALTFVSLLYYWRPLYDGFGIASIWAVLTVVVVFEFTVGN